MLPRLHRADRGQSERRYRDHHQRTGLLHIAARTMCVIGVPHDSCRSRRSQCEPKLQLCCSMCRSPVPSRGADARHLLPGLTQSALWHLAVRRRQCCQIRLTYNLQVTRHGAAHMCSTAWPHQCCRPSDPPCGARAETSARDSPRSREASHLLVCLRVAVPRICRKLPAACW